MAQMASGVQGANYAKGTFTTDTGSTYTLSFGKTFSSYLYYVEMTDASKTALQNSGQTSAKMFACFGAYPNIEFGNSDAGGFLAFRVNPSTNAIDKSASAAPSSINSTSITFGNNAITGGSNGLYREYTYDYYIVEIK